MTKPRFIFVLDAVHFPVLFGDKELARLQQGVDLELVPVSPDELQAGGGRFARVEGIISSWGMAALTPALLKSLPQLRAVFHAAGTIKAIATPASWERGVRISSAACENAKPTAEFAFAQIILSLKRAWTRLFDFRERRISHQNDPLMPGCYGSTVALLALGKIGRLVAQRLTTLDVKVLAYDPMVSADEAAALNVTLCSFDEAFARADVISCHMPLTDETTGSIGRQQFAAMKPGSTFINTGRGGLVREGEMAQVLRERPDICAVLDVTEFEPPLPDSPLFALRNVVLTPHIAGSMGPECRRLGIMMVDEVERYLAGQPLLGEVHQQQLPVIA